MPQSDEGRLRVRTVEYLSNLTKAITVRPALVVHVPVPAIRAGMRCDPTSRGAVSGRGSLWTGVGQAADWLAATGDTEEGLPEI